MTYPTDGPGVDSVRVDEGRHVWPVAIASLVVGLVIGALIGFAVGATSPASHQASTSLSVQPDPTVSISSSDNNSNVAQLDSTAYIQSQLVVINGAPLADQVQSQLGLASAPNVTATQVGQTYVVQIQASAADSDTALGIVRDTASGYRQTRIAQLSSEIRGLLASTRRQINTVQGALTAQRSGSNANSPLTPSQTALQTQYEQLLSERSSLDATLSQAGSLVTVVAPARIVTGSLSATERDVIIGGVVGALLGLIVLIAVRRAVHRVRNVGDLAALNVPVLLPVQARRPLRSLRTPAVWKAGPTRLLAARLYAERLRQDGVLVVVGAGRRVGTSFVAATVAAALTEQSPVLLVVADDPGGVAPPRHEATGPSAQGPVETVVPGLFTMTMTTGRLRPDEIREQLAEVVGRARESGWLVVVDAPPLAESGLALLAADSDGVLALVAGRGKSSPAEVLAADELLTARGLRQVGAVLNDVPGPARRLLPVARLRLAAGTQPVPRQPGVPGSPDAGAGQPPLGPDGHDEGAPSGYPDDTYSEDNSRFVPSMYGGARHDMAKDDRPQHSERVEGDSPIYP